jgi:glycosyltransferase involved in cell wall biosynthesis
MPTNALTLSLKRLDALREVTDTAPPVSMRSRSIASAAPLYPSIGIVAVVPDRWGSSVWMPRQQILTRLAQYFQVVWLDRPSRWRDCWLPWGERWMEPGTVEQVAPGFTVQKHGYSSPHFVRPDWLRIAMLRQRLRAARKHLLDQGVRQTVLYIWRDRYAPAIDLVDHDLSVYHVDDDYAFSNVDTPNGEQEVELLRRVDQVIVHSTRLFEKKGGVNPSTVIIPNGVDYHHFASRHVEPPDLAQVPRPRIGYVGVIKKQLDLPLLSRLVAARPEWSFVFVGPVGKIDSHEDCLRELAAQPNAYFLGAKPLDALPAYVQHMDVGLLCYAVDDYTRYIYPLKLHESLASGRPPVASPIDSLRQHADVVALASSDAEWLSEIENALCPDASTPERVKRRQDRARQHDWESLTRRVADLLLARLRSAASPRRRPPRMRLWRPDSQGS